MKRWKIVRRESDGTVMETGLRYFFKFNANEVCKHLNILVLFGAKPRDIFTEAFFPAKKTYTVVSVKTPWTEFGPPSSKS